MGRIGVAVELTAQIDRLKDTVRQLGLSDETLIALVRDRLRLS